MLRSRAGPLPASRWRIPAGQLRIGPLRQPAFDVLKDLLLLDLVEDLVVEPRERTECAARRGAASEERLTTDRVHDLAVPPVQQQKRNPELGRRITERP